LAAWLILSAFALVSCSGLTLPGWTIPGLTKHPQAPAPPGTTLLQQPAGPGVGPTPGEAPSAPLPLALGPPKVGLLLPLSGPSAALGQAMLQASEMALFDAPDNGVELLPRDTQGAAAGAADAARDVIAQGAKLIIGPLLAAEVE